MSIEGSINVSALFHDRDGTTAVKVVSLRSSNEYTSGKVAIITGTAGTTGITFSAVDDGSPVSTLYRDASGAFVSFAQITRLALKANSGTVSLVGGTFDMQVASGHVAFVPCSLAEGDSFSVSAASGTVSYTVLIYGA